MCNYWYLWCVSLLLLIINTFNWNIKSTGTEMALTEIFCSYYVNKTKRCLLLIGNFPYYITVYIWHFFLNIASELLVGSKMVITLELKLCLSNFSRGIEKQKGHQGTNITLTFTRQFDLFLIPYFWPIFDNFQNETDCLSVNGIIDLSQDRISSIELSPSTSYRCFTHPTGNW